MKRKWLQSCNGEGNQVAKNFIVVVIVAVVVAVKPSVSMN